MFSPTVLLRMRDEAQILLAVCGKAIIVALVWVLSRYAFGIEYDITTLLVIMALLEVVRLDIKGRQKERYLNQRIKELEATLNERPN